MRRLAAFIAARLNSLPASQGGNVAMIFGLCAIPLFIAAGMGIDMWRAYAVKVRLGAALDAAALAVGSTNPANYTTAQLQTRMQNYFSANYPATATLGAPGTPTMAYSATNNNIINFTATASVPTMFMRVVGINTLNVGVTSQVTRGISGLELALVLDNTGSMMCGDGETANCSQGVPPTHMDTLRTDAQSIIDTLFSNSVDTSKLWIAVVPYVTAVNIGPAMTTQTGPLATSHNNIMSSYLSTNATGQYVDYKGNVIDDAFGNPITYDSSQSQTSTEWLGCVVEPTSSNEDTTAVGPDITEPSSTNGWGSYSWTPYWWATESTAGPYNGNNNDWVIVTPHTSTTCVKGGSNQGHGGCERGYSPQTTTTYTTTAQALFTEVENGDYSNDNSSAIYLSYGPNLGCPMPMQRMTNNQSTLDAVAQGLKSRANSGTMIHVGMIWGWRAISPNKPFSDGRPYGTSGWVKAVVLETDGINDVGANPDYSGLGYLSDGKMGSTNLNTALSNLNGRLADVCAAMAAQGIVIYTVGLGQGATNTTLSGCAANGGAFYAAPTAADLTTAFQQIATSLNNLRLSK
jgi:Flp pilus assembly protein TadG